MKRVWSLEEKYWFQYSRVKWLEFGDKNTKFFHQTTKYLRQFNKVLRIKDESSVWLDEELDIIKKFRGFTIVFFGPMVLGSGEIRLIMCLKWFLFI